MLAQQLELLREQQRRMQVLLDEVALQADHVRRQNEALRVVNQTLQEQARLLEQQNEKLAAAQAESRRAMEVAEAANRAKDEFLANVSHEIRTPMNAILGMTELVLETPLSDGQHQSLKTVRSAAGSLLGTINDLLDFSKIEAGKLELDPNPFGLREAVGETLRALAVRAHRKGLELVCQVQPAVPDALIGDVNRLRQVLINLVGNAIKFTEKGEVVVEIDLPAGQDSGGEVSVRFSIRDTGIGIPRAKQETIFRAFEQEDMSTTRRYGGTGLGLTIAGRLITLMGGEITVESEAGRGSTFTFTARFGRQLQLVEAVAPPPSDTLRDLRVLVVDDSALNRHLLHAWLRGWEMDPTAVGDGIAAMDRLWEGYASGKPYTLVILDAHMPDTDGLALVARMRERGALSATRIILLTAGDRPDDLDRYRDVRVDAHLLKPVLQDELLQTIHSLLSPSEGDTPVAGSPTTARPAARPQVVAAVPLHVLVAEDSEFNSLLLEQLLASRGHRVRIATTGRETLRQIEANSYDLLLLDVHMPELDGFQVIQAIRERERVAGGHLPVVAVTARSRKEDRQRCVAAGMDEFLIKPISAADLWATIDRVVVSRTKTRVPLLD